MKKVTFLMIGTMMIGGCAGKPPDGLGVADARLSPCPDRPNCVSSQTTDPSHYVAPIDYEGSRQKARKRIKAVIVSLPRAEIITDTADYIRAEFTSAVMRFVDDVEFYFPDDDAVIHVRSASRLGYWDFGVNRKRVRIIRKQFANR